LRSWSRAPRAPRARGRRPLRRRPSRHALPRSARTRPARRGRCARTLRRRPATATSTRSAPRTPKWASRGAIRSPRAIPGTASRSASPSTARRTRHRVPLSPREAPRGPAPRPRSRRRIRTSSRWRTVSIAPAAARHLRNADLGVRSIRWISDRSTVTRDAWSSRGSRRSTRGSKPASGSLMPRAKLHPLMSPRSLPIWNAGRCPNHWPRGTT
jgi:hypothetical protein